MGGGEASLGQSSPSDSSSCAPWWRLGGGLGEEGGAALLDLVSSSVWPLRSMEY